MGFFSVEPRPICRDQIRKIQWCVTKLEPIKIDDVFLAEFYASEYHPYIHLGHPLVAQPTLFSKQLQLVSRHAIFALAVLLKEVVQAVVQLSHILRRYPTQLAAGALAVTVGVHAAGLTHARKKGEAELL